jgi:hypothetical protein
MKRMCLLDIAICFVIALTMSVLLWWIIPPWIQRFEQNMTWGVISVGGN